MKLLNKIQILKNEICEFHVLILMTTGFLIKHSPSVCEISGDIQYIGVTFKEMASIVFRQSLNTFITGSYNFWEKGTSVQITLNYSGCNSHGASSVQFWHMPVYCCCKAPLNYSLN